MLNQLITADIFEISGSLNARCENTRRVESSVQSKQDFWSGERGEVVHADGRRESCASTIGGSGDGRRGSRPFQGEKSGSRTPSVRPGNKFCIIETEPRCSFTHCTCTTSGSCRTLVGAKKRVDGFLSSWAAQACVNIMVEKAKQASQFEAERAVISGWKRARAVAKWASEAWR